MGILIRVRKIGSFIFWRVQRWHGVEPGVGLPESVRFELMLMLAGTEAEAVADGRLRPLGFSAVADIVCIRFDVAARILPR